MKLEYPVVTNKDFPHGLKCTNCHRVIDEGQPYTEWFDSVINGVVSVTLVCVYC